MQLDCPAIKPWVAESRIRRCQHTETGVRGSWCFEMASLKAMLMVSVLCITLQVTCSDDSAKEGFAGMKTVSPTPAPAPAPPVAKAPAPVAPVAPVAPAPAPKAPLNCTSACEGRCGAAKLHKRCLKYCNICCAECKCVPSGQSGHKDECACYRDKKNSKGDGKCP